MLENYNALSYILSKLTKTTSMSDHFLMGKNSTLSWFKGNSIIYMYLLVVYFKREIFTFKNKK